MALTEKEKLYQREWRKKNLEKSRKQQRDWQRKNRIENAEYVREKDRIHRKTREEARKKYAAEHRKVYKRDPIKTAARTILNSAVKKGILERPDKCQQCDSECVVYAHHEDYLKPLDVQWLCMDCHAKRHFPIKATSQT